MRTSFLVCFLFLSAISSFAQEDSLFVSVRDSTWVFSHKTVPGESVFIVAKRYNVPPAILADVNGLNFQDGLPANTLVYIPLSSFNLTGKEPVVPTAARKIYRRVSAKDDLVRLSKYAMVLPVALKQWNNLKDNTIAPGQVLFVGWVRYDATQTPFSNSAGSSGIDNSETVIQITKPVIDTLTDDEKAYLQQTDSGRNVIEEKGGVVFFNSTGKVKSSDTYFAFHATAPRGTMIKVHNPGTGLTIYVKVLGPLPATKQYVNSIMGIGSVAKEALGVTENKAWCELQYAGN